MRVAVVGPACGGEVECSGAYVSLELSRAERQRIIAAMTDSSLQLVIRDAPCIEPEGS